MKEVLDFHTTKINQSDVLSKLNLSPEKYFIVSIHREENVDYPENLKSLISDLKSLIDHYKIPVIVSTHPRTRKRLEDLGLLNGENEFLQFLKPLGFSDYIHLQMKAKCVLSDSGTISEEASILRFPAIMIRNAHERPEGMDEGITVMSSVGGSQIINSVDMVCKQTEEYSECINPVQDYESSNVSIKTARIIQSYINYVNNYVWRKNEVKKSFYEV
jgi:UDP-N-acetylglucosamine 2-epimerase (non-hydrolysing)